MIVVRNTLELERNYDIYNLPDNMPIKVTGGLTGKSKYDAPHYHARVTYTAGQMKAILRTMQSIERTIDPSWSDYTKAEHIYRILGTNITYNHNYREDNNHNASSLATLTDRKGICAGYALLYKEMLDRQGIPCDYVRGTAINKQGKTEKHAWCILQIDNKSIAVDLTWDSPSLQRNEQALKYFGNNPDFANNHTLDSDEIQYSLSSLSPHDIKRLQTPKSQNIVSTPIASSTSDTLQQKHNYIESAIATTYDKYVALYGETAAKHHTSQALIKFATTGVADSFTRDGNVRKALLENVLPHEALDYLCTSYLNNTLTNPNDTRQLPDNQRLLNAALHNTSHIYSVEQGQLALKKFVRSNDRMSFTNKGVSGSRNSLNHINNSDILLFLSEDTIQAVIDKNKLHAEAKTIFVDAVSTPSIANNEKSYFSKQELSMVEMPKSSVFKTAMQWIKDKLNIKDKSSPINDMDTHER